MFSKKSKSILGIDIGTSSIKVVQLRKEENRFELETYGELSTFGYLERLNETFQGTSLRTLEVVTREMIRILIEKAKVSTKDVIMAIPVFSSFVSIIELPEMAEKELAQAIEFEARKYVPIPLSEVILDWKIIESGTIKNNSHLPSFNGKRILLIAVPKEVVNKYLKIAEDLKLKIKALELESFSLARSLIIDNKISVCILDIGARATSFTIVDKGIIQMSHSLDVAGAEMTKILAISLNIGSKRAEEFKLAYGFENTEEKKKEIKELLSVPMNKIINEIERMVNSYQEKTGRKIEKLILNGGSAQLSGLKEYIEEKLNIKTIIANPWAKVVYKSSLQQKLKEIGPQFSVAAGAAMRDD
ncbi:type IV pilus assembly protein PilM [Patescibacteria group bacterium]|nr:type IV pilus assembly protein PilM [Patescibacteria group bacterium]